MKKAKVILFCLVVSGILSVSTLGANGPKDPGGVGNGAIGFGIGPGLGFYGSTGVGPAFLVHYDQSLWQAGPGCLSLGGQIGTSFFSNSYDISGTGYKAHWINFGFIGRCAYHYGWKVPGLDTYGGFGAGSRISLYSDNNDLTDKKGLEIGFQPTAFFGATYYFNDVVGVNAEMGENFAFFSFGLNFRIVR